MNATPWISIIIPTYNRPERLDRCLSAIACLDYPKERFEVIVVDDGSQMSLTPVVETFRSQLNLSLITQANAGPAAARNAGAAKAQGEFLVFTDDDCQPAPDWLTALETQFQETPDCLLGGTTINALPNNPFASASQALIDYVYSYYNADRRRARFFASNNIAVPTKPFRAIGGFDVSFSAASEDREFCDRWLRQGYPMVYAPEAVVYHAHPLTLRSFWQQHFNYGRGAYRFHQMRSRCTPTQRSREPLSYYLNLLTYPFRRASQHPTLLLANLLVLSQLASTLGLLWERQKSALASQGKLLANE